MLRLISRNLAIITIPVASVFLRVVPLCSVQWPQNGGCCIVVVESVLLLGCRATIIQHQSARVGHANVGSVALPAVLRAGDAGGQAQVTEGSLQKAQHSQLSSQMPVNGHVSPSVSSCMTFCLLIFLNYSDLVFDVVYGYSVDYAVDENSSVFSLIRMHWLPSARICGQ